MILIDSLWCREGGWSGGGATVSGPVGKSHAAKAVALAPLPVALVLFTRGVREGPLAVHLALLNLAAVDIALQEPTCGQEESPAELGKLLFPRNAPRLCSGGSLC